MECRDFLGHILLKGDWIVRAASVGRTARLIYSRLEEDPKVIRERLNGQVDWLIPIRSFDNWRKNLGGIGRAEHPDRMIRADWEIPAEVQTAGAALPLLDTTL